MSDATSSYGVFISHASEDRWVARQLARHAREAGAVTFLDAVDVDDGDDFEERILDAAEGCGELLVLVTPWALEKSRYLWMEIGAFWFQRKRIVALLHGVTPDMLHRERNLPIRLQRTHLRQLNEADDYFARLKRRIEEDENERQA